MNDNLIQDEQELVPEVDPQALQETVLPPDVAACPPPCPSTTVPAALALPDDPQQAIKALPPALTAHIRDLIAQADAEGYLRGRNEQIEATQHFDTPDDDCDVVPSPMPRYSRCSIWDL